MSDAAGPDAPQRTATILERAIARAQAGQLDRTSVLWVLASSELILVNEVEPGFLAFPQQPMLVSRGAETLIAVFTHPELALPSLQGARVSVAVPGFELLRRMPEGVGMVVNPGWNLGFELPAVGLRGFTFDLVEASVVLEPAAASDTLEPAKTPAPPPPPSATSRLPEGPPEPPAEERRNEGVRARYADAAHFDKVVDACEVMAGVQRDRLSKPQDQLATPKPTIAESVFQNMTSAFCAQYSRGDDRDALLARFVEWLDACELQEREHLASREQRVIPLPMALFLPRLWLVSAAIALEVDEPTFDRVASVVAWMDSDRLITSLIATRRPDVPVAETLWLPEKFRGLQEVVDAAPDDRPNLMVKYLAAWYGKMYRMRWRDGHKYLPRLEYIGYWSFEAAGVTAAFGIDDRRFLTTQYYPADLAVTPAR